MNATTINDALLVLGTDRFATMLRDVGALRSYMTKLNALLTDREVWPAETRTLDDRRRAHLAAMIGQLDGLRDQAHLTMLIGAPEV